MTIETILSRNDYVGNGSQTVFAFTFRVLYEVAESPVYSIQVITTDLLGIETVKTQITDYTVTLNTDGTGTVTFATAPITGHKITFLRSMSKTQRADYVNAGTDKFPGNVHELALDKLTLIVQEYLEKFNRVVTLPKNSLLSNIEFPIDATRADQVLCVNSAGNNLTTKNLADIGLAPVTNFIKTLFDDIDAAAARNTLSAQTQSSKLDTLSALVSVANLATLANLASIVNLSALAGLVGSANKIPYFTGAGAMDIIDFPSSGWTMLATATALNNLTIDFDNFLDITYEVYALTYTRLFAANDEVDLSIRFGIGATPTYQTAGYRFSKTGGRDGSVVQRDSGNTTTDRIIMNDFTVNALGNGSGEGVSGTMFIHGPSSGLGTYCHYHHSRIDASGRIQNETGTGQWMTLTPVTSLRIFLSAGNIASGEFKLYGLKKS